MAGTKHLLEDVDVDGVHMVGSPANRRPFAIVKSATPKPEPGDATVKKSELIDKVQQHKGDEVPVDQVVALVGKEALAKALGVELPTEEPKPGLPDEVKKQLPTEVQSYINKLEATQQEHGEQLQALVKAREDETKAALKKRAEALQERGIEIDVEKATEAEIAGAERVAKQYDETLKKLGVFTQKGSSKSGVAEERSAIEIVKQEVVRQLGREPENEAEAARVRKRIYEANPGLLDLVREEERAAARA